MAAITPEFLMDLESRMRVITGETYDRLNSNLWYPEVTKVTSSGARKEILNWFLSTLTIKRTGADGGTTRYEDLVSRTFAYEHSHAGVAFKIHKDRLLDTDGNGVSLAAKWSADAGAYMSYWPQKETWRAMSEGHLSGRVAYDGQIYFSGAHPYNPYRVSAGTYANLHTGGSGAGAVPISEAVTTDVALANLATVMAYVRGIKMPNGEDPRMLRASAIICGPRLAPRVAQLTNAKFIAQMANGAGAGSADVEALIQTLGYAKVVVVDEMAGFESDTTYFVATESVLEGELGSLIYSEREPFSIDYYTGDGGTNVELKRRNEFEWIVDGRNELVYGHPFGLHKCKAA